MAQTLPTAGEPARLPLLGQQRSPQPFLLPTTMTALHPASGSPLLLTGLPTYRGSHVFFDDDDDSDSNDDDVRGEGVRPSFDFAGARSLMPMTVPPVSNAVASAAVAAATTKAAAADHPPGISKKILKYWHQRYDLFSRFDEGIVMDEEGWYSVTPEAIARQIAENCRCDTIVDAFTGCGGNAIQFAFTCERVIACDIDPAKIACARHNATIYGVEDRIEFLCGDFLKLAPGLQADVVFLSPPWGGPSYSKHSTFQLERMRPNGFDIFKAARRITPHIAYFMPRNVDMQQMLSLARGETPFVEENMLKGRLKALTFYYGELAADPATTEADS